MDRAALERQLQAEGYEVTYIQKDEPGIEHLDHKHRITSAHIVLEGSMDITLNGVVHHLGSGDRLDVPANANHSAIVGAEGCTYLVGEK
jgi:quercetin dioxygenase-like cupin family protein